MSSFEEEFFMVCIKCKKEIPENSLYCNLCGIDTSELTPHSTRHTFASLSSAAGLRPENLQKIIGHANFSTTAQVYIHQDIDTLLHEMGKLKK